MAPPLAPNAPMTRQIDLGDIRVDVVRKDIKNINLSVRPPSGQVRISAPLCVSHETVRAFALSKLDWIRRQQGKILQREPVRSSSYLSDENHLLWGALYPLQVVEHNSAPSVDIIDSRMVLRVRPAADTGTRKAVFDAWYRRQLKQAVPTLITTWEKKMGVTVNRFTVRQMKTRWGSCTPRAKTIRLSLELAKKPPECLEYVLVHEMTHLLEPSHNNRFVGFMDKFLPEWRLCKDTLNKGPGPL